MKQLTFNFEGEWDDFAESNNGLKTIHQSFYQELFEAFENHDEIICILKYGFQIDILQTFIVTYLKWKSVWHDTFIMTPSYTESDILSLKLDKFRTKCVIVERANAIKNINIIFEYLRAITDKIFVWDDSLMGWTKHIWYDGNWKNISWNN